MANGLETPLGGAVVFLKNFGFFDIILPFLLVFTFVFAILEKSRIFGTVGEGEKAKPKKNLNAMFAFTVAFFVVISVNVTQIIQKSLPLVSLVLLILICFMLLVGALMGSSELNIWDDKFKPKWIKYLLLVFVLIAVIVVFLWASDWLDLVLGFLFVNVGSPIGWSIVLLLVMALAIYLIMKDTGQTEGKEGK